MITIKIPISNNYSEVEKLQKLLCMLYSEEHNIATRVYFERRVEELNKELTKYLNRSN